MLIQHSAEVMNVGFLLNAIDLVAPGLEQAMADVIDKTENVHWIATAGDPRMIHPKLRVMFLVYLGLGQNGRMRYLPHDEQRLLIDKGSLIKAKK